MDESRLMRREDVVNYVQLTVPSIYHLMNTGRFPRPVRVGKRAVRWLREDIDQWVEELVQERDTDETSTAG